MPVRAVTCAGVLLASFSLTLSVDAFAQSATGAQRTQAGAPQTNVAPVGAPQTNGAAPADSGAPRVTPAPTRTTTVLSDDRVRAISMVNGVPRICNGC